MPRLALSPTIAFERQDEALRLLRQGHGVREVARMVGCAASSVIRWRDAAAAAPDGRPPRRWDVHGTAGTRWDGTEGQRARAAAFRTRGRERRQWEVAHAAPTASVPDPHMHPNLIQARRDFESAPAYWDENGEVVRRARVRIAIPADVVTRGGASAWTTPALMYLFDVRAVDDVPWELYPVEAERERVALSRLERTARGAGFMQDADGIWYLPDSDDRV